MTWSGPRATQARARIACTLPAPCTRCTELVYPEQAWDVDHLHALAQGGRMWDPTNQGPAHAACNRSAGAVLGHQLRGRKMRRLPPL